MTPRFLLRAAVALLSALALTACRGAPTPTPTATSAPTAPAPAALFTATPPASTTTPEATASPEATAAGDQLPAGWQLHTDDLLSIAIPPRWRTIRLNSEDAKASYESFRQLDREMASIVGGPEQLQEAVLWAFGPAQEGFTDNLNIRRSPSGPQIVTEMQPVLDALLPEYEKMGLKVTSTDATLRVNGFPAARITYTLTMNSSDRKGFEVRGRQIFVAGDSDLWILSFSTTPEREGEMAAQFERSAQSFRLK